MTIVPVMTAKWTAICGIHGTAAFGASGTTVKAIHRVTCAALWIFEM